MKMIRGFTALLITLVFLSACKPTTSEPIPLVDTPMNAEVQSTKIVTPEPEQTITPNIISTVTTQPTNTIAPVPSLNVSASNQTGPLYDLSFSIPVGKGGVRYQGVGVERMEITGPNALAALPDGRFIIADPLDNRLLYYKPDGNFEKAIDLFTLGIVNVSDLQVAANWLFVKEISFDISPTRYRVNKLSVEGELIASYDIPAEYRLADNLPGIIVDGDGRLLLDIEMVGIPPGFKYHLPSNVIQLVDSQGNWSPIATDGLRYNERIFHHYDATISGNQNAVIAGDIRVETALTLGFGGLRILGVLPDGRFFLTREDVVQDSPVIEVDQTVHFISFDGVQLGVARYPLSERLYYVERNITLGPDGCVYALLPREKSLDVLRLNLYNNLNPLIPGAAEPLVVKASQ